MMEPNENMKLAAKILELNPDLPKAFKSKFEIMSVNSHFSNNVFVVIKDAERFGIQLNKEKAEV